MKKNIISELKDMAKIANNMILWIFQAQVLVAYNCDKASEIQFKYL